MFVMILVWFWGSSCGDFLIIFNENGVILWDLWGFYVVICVWAFQGSFLECFWLIWNGFWCDFCRLLVGFWVVLGLIFVGCWHLFWCFFNEFWSLSFDLTVEVYVGRGSPVNLRISFGISFLYNAAKFSQYHVFFRYQCHHTVWSTQVEMLSPFHGRESREQQ